MDTKLPLQIIAFPVNAMLWHEMVIAYDAEGGEITYVFMDQFDEYWEILPFIEKESYQLTKTLDIGGYTIGE